MRDQLAKIVTQLLDDLKRDDSLRRQHANFWNFSKKSIKEIGVFSKLVKTLERDLNKSIVSWQLTSDDPPDVLVVNADNTMVGVEITELVNQGAIEAQISNSEDYAHIALSFDTEKAIELIRTIIAAKEKKLLDNQQDTKIDFNDFILLLHTDEAMLDSDGVQEYIEKNNVTFDSKVFRSIYLIFSFEPKKHTCPILKLL